MDIRIDHTAAEPQTVDEARNAVERSRQRISSTLDQLEGRIVEKKHELQDRADVLRPVRDRIAERPFTAVVIAVGVGALLGSLGGSDDDEDSRAHRHARSGRVRGELSDTDRRELREWRKARKERLRATLGRHRDDSSDGESSSRFDALKHQLMGAVTTAITTAVTRRVRSLAMDNISSLIGGDESRHHRGGHEEDRGFREDRPAAYDRADAGY